MNLSVPKIVVADPDIDEVIDLINHIRMSGLEVEHITKRKNILQKIEVEKVDVLLLNLKQVDSDAVSISQEIRSMKHVEQPFILVYNDTSEDFIQITCFNSGADAFISRPLNPLIVVARLKALLRRNKGLQVNKHNSQSGFFVDYETYQIVNGDNRYTLPKKEFEIVAFLLSSPKKVFSRNEIAVKIWENEKVALSRTIDIHIRNIRKIIGKDSLRTIKGMGYSIN